MSRRNGCQSPPIGLLPRTPPDYLATAPVAASDHHSSEQTAAAMMAAPLASNTGSSGIDNNGLLFVNDGSWHACFRPTDPNQLPVSYPAPPSAPERQASSSSSSFTYHQQHQCDEQQSHPLGVTSFAQSTTSSEPTTSVAANFDICYRDFNQAPQQHQQQQFPAAALAHPQPIYVHTNRSIKTSDFKSNAIFPYDLSAPSPSSSFSSSSSSSTSASSVASSPATQTPTSMDQHQAIFPPPPTSQWYSMPHANNGALQQQPQLFF